MTTMTIRTIAIALLVTAGAFGQAFAQSAAIPDGKMTLTDALREQAEVLLVTPDQHRQAAMQLQEEVSQRDARDPAAIQALAVSGRLLFATGELNGARKAMLATGELALKTGDVVTAAHALLDAAYIDFLQGRDSRAEALVEAAEGLSASPLLDETQRKGITLRIARPALI